MNFNLYKIKVNPCSDVPYYSTERDYYLPCVEVEQKEVTSYSVMTSVRFNSVMEDFCTFQESKTESLHYTKWEVNPDYVCVIECIDMDRDDDGLDHTVYSVVNCFYSENTSDTGLIYGLPYWLHFVKVGG